MNMNEREEGELSDNDIVDEIYRPLERPPIRQEACREETEQYNSDSSNDESFIKKPPSNSQVPVHNPAKRKRNNIWSNVMAEENVMDLFQGVGLEKKRKNDRSVESYNYPRRHPTSGSDSLTEDEKRPQIRHRVQRKKVRSSQDNNVKRERCLLDVGNVDSANDSDVGCLIAERLYEKKAALIVRVVEVLGRDKAIELYKETQRIEKNGGLQIMNGSRRRTSGGVFLHLLKTFNGVTNEQTTRIFENEHKKATLSRKRKRSMTRHANKRDSSTDGSDSVGDFNIEGDLGAKNFADEPGGSKCPGSTPVTTPYGSDSDEKIQSDALSMYAKVVEGIEQKAMSRTADEMDADYAQMLT